MFHAVLREGYSCVVLKDQEKGESNLRHHPLSQAFRAHSAQGGNMGNFTAWLRFHHESTRIWRHWLSRRCRAGDLAWDRFSRLLEQFPLPQPLAIRFGVLSRKEFVT
ncbi:hypothetical protein V5E97_31800 [Singulisphaera sp. Ch08]|uniref:Uncharacterized protein n=1 Tax=Singulisphaera sp. Ch08 TaxID=3120278 RepID=A0AAU7CCH7_9BACT